MIISCKVLILYPLSHQILKKLKNGHAKNKYVRIWGVNVCGRGKVGTIENLSFFLWFLKSFPLFVGNIQKQNHTLNQCKTTHKIHL